MAAQTTKSQVNYCCTVIILLGVMVMVCAQPQYEVQIQFPVIHSYRGSAIRNSLADGTCCEPTETAPNCTTPCTYIYITLCFREEQHDMNDMNSSNCPLGGLTTPFGRYDLYTFTANPGTTTTAYPGGIQLFFIIEDRALLPFRLIDCGRIGIAREIVDRETGEFKARGLGGKNNIIILTISQLRVVCKENYNGSDCGTMVCQPRDDSTGHFNCNPDGRKVCLPGYQNPETNCVEAITTMIPTTDPTTTTMETSATLLTTTSTPDNSIPEATNDGTMETTPTRVTYNQVPVGMDAVPIAAGVGACLVILLLILIVNIVAVVLFFKSRNRRQMQGVQSMRDDIVMAQNPVYVMKETNTHEQEPVYYETVS